MEDKKAENGNKRALVPVSDASECSMYLDTNLFDQGQRAALLLSKSDIVPTHYRGQPANCFIALDFAKRMGLNPLLYMQNTYVVHGKMGIEAKLAIALINKSGRFKGSIQYKFTGNGESLECEAFAINKLDGTRISDVCSVQMAKDMGWWTKSGSFWPKMTKRMLKYRSATFMIKLNCPEVLFGMDTVEELRDRGTIDITVEAQDLGVGEAEDTKTPVNLSQTKKKKAEPKKSKEKLQNKDEHPEEESPNYPGTGTVENLDGNPESCVEDLEPEVQQLYGIINSEYESTKRKVTKYFKHDFKRKGYVKKAIEDNNVTHAIAIMNTIGV